MQRFTVFYLDFVLILYSVTINNQIAEVFLDIIKFFYSTLLNIDTVHGRMSVKPVEASITAKLMATFQPAHLEVFNESHMHSVPPGSETHFKVILAADSFSGRRQVQRHQAIYGCLADELKNGVHALALHTFSSEEWSASNNVVPASPDCLGGSKHDN